MTSGTHSLNDSSTRFFDNNHACYHCLSSQTSIHSQTLTAGPAGCLAAVERSSSDMHAIHRNPVTCFLYCSALALREKGGVALTNRLAATIYCRYLYLEAGEPVHIGVAASCCT